MGIPPYCSFFAGNCWCSLLSPVSKRCLVFVWFNARFYLQADFMTPEWLLVSNRISWVPDADIQNKRVLASLSEIALSLTLKFRAGDELRE